MPNISISNYPYLFDFQLRLVTQVRKACLEAHETIPELGKWEPKDLAINAAGPCLFPEDGSAIQIVVEVMYYKPERTSEVLARFGELLCLASRSAYSNHPVEVTFRPLFDLQNGVVVSG